MDIEGNDAREDCVERRVRVSRDLLNDWKADLGQGLGVHPQTSDHETKAEATPGPEGLTWVPGLGQGPGDSYVLYACL